MSLAACLGDIIQKNDSLEINNSSSFNPLRLFIRWWNLSRVTKNNFKILKKLFDTDIYKTNVKKAQEEEIREILGLLINLEGNIFRQMQIISSSKFPFFIIPSLKSASRMLEKENKFVEEKIDDYELSLNNDFLKAMEQIVDGANNSNIDISKVKNIASIL